MADRDEATGLTPKQEAFALAYFETGNAAEAYRRAYDVGENTRDQWLYVEASQLLDHPKVALRVKALQEQAEQLSMFTRMRALEEYEEARMLALKTGSAAAAVSAVTGKVKLFGLEAPARSRLEHTGANGGPIQHEDVTADAEDFTSRMARLAARRAAAGGTGEADGEGES